MAGSYGHIVNDDGTLRSNEDFVGMIENLGDAYEMAEEMYGMIWWLADGNPRAVETAAKYYREGIEEFAPGAQKARS